MLPDCVQDYRLVCDGLEWIICPTVPVVPLIAPHPMFGARVRPLDGASVGMHKLGACYRILPAKYPLYERSRRAAWSCVNTAEPIK